MEISIIEQPIKPQIIVVLPIIIKVYPKKGVWLNNVITQNKKQGTERTEKVNVRFEKLISPIIRIDPESMVQQTVTKTQTTF